MNLFDQLVAEAIKNHTALAPLRPVVEKELLHHAICIGWPSRPAPAGSRDHPNTSSIAAMSSCMVAAVSLPMLEMRKVRPLILP